MKSQPKSHGPAQIALVKRRAVLALDLTAHAIGGVGEEGCHHPVPRAGRCRPGRANPYRGPGPAQARSTPPQHRADVRGQRRDGRGERLRERARRSHAEHRSARRRGHPAHELQRGVLVHPVPDRAAHGPLLRADRRQLHRGHDAVGDHHCRSAAVARLRDGTVRQVGRRRRRLAGPPRADGPGIRRMVGHSGHQRHGAVLLLRGVRSVKDPGSLHLGGTRRRSVAARQALHARLAAHD